MGSIREERHTRIKNVVLPFPAAVAISDEVATSPPGNKKKSLFRSSTRVYLFVCTLVLLKKNLE